MGIFFSSTEKRKERRERIKEIRRAGKDEHEHWLFFNTTGAILTVGLIGTIVASFFMKDLLIQDIGEDPLQFQHGLRRTSLNCVSSSSSLCQGTLALLDDSNDENSASTDRVNFCRRLRSLDEDLPKDMTYAAQSNILASGYENAKSDCEDIKLAGDILFYGFIASLAVSFTTMIVIFHETYFGIGAYTSEYNKYYKSFDMVKAPRVWPWLSYFAAFLAGASVIIWHFLLPDGYNSSTIFTYTISFLCITIAAYTTLILLYRSAEKSVRKQVSGGGGGYYPRGGRGGYGYI